MLKNTVALLPALLHFSLNPHSFPCYSNRFPAALYPFQLAWFFWKRFSGWVLWILTSYSQYNNYVICDHYVISIPILYSRPSPRPIARNLHDLAFEPFLASNCAILADLAIILSHHILRSTIYMQIFLPPTHVIISPLLSIFYIIFYSLLSLSAQFEFSSFLNSAERGA